MRIGTSFLPYLKDVATCAVNEALHCTPTGPGGLQWGPPERALREDRASMKYRQPGYRDNEYKEEREKRRQEKSGPRGPREPRGTPREACLVMRCYQCGHQEQARESVEPAALCPNCKTALHCCRNCVHFDPRARFECRQTITARILSKTAANECSFFR